MRRFLIVLPCLVALAIAAQAFGRSDGRRPPTETLRGHLFEPAVRGFSPARLRQLRVPDGFRVNVFARGLKNARIMVVAPSGAIYLSRRDQGDVLMLRDRDGDGRADMRRVVASGIEYAHGLALRGNQLFIAADRKVLRATTRPDGTLTRPVVLIDDLPDSGQHPGRGIGFGPDGRLYISIGSTCNACPETNRENATLLRARPDGSSREIHAKGLRHTIGFAWEPASRRLWGFDHGSEWRGDSRPPEELNRLVRGGDYGWPFGFASKRPDRLLVSEPKGMTKAAYYAKTRAPAVTFAAHRAPIVFLFYTGSQFPTAYQGDAFVTFRGSWNRTRPVGYKVVRVHFENGRPVRSDDFLAGFLLEGGDAQFGRLAGLAVARDGSLLVAEDQNGIIYRVSSTAARAR